MRITTRSMVAVLTGFGATVLMASALEDPLKGVMGFVKVHNLPHRHPLRLYDINDAGIGISVRRPEVGALLTCHPRPTAAIAPS